MIMDDSELYEYIKYEDIDVLVEQYLRIRDEVVRRIKNIYEELGGGQLRLPKSNYVYAGDAEDDARYDIMGVEKEHGEIVIIAAETETSKISGGGKYHPDCFHIGSLSDLYDTLKLIKKGYIKI